MAQVSFTAAMKAFFGLKPGQELAGFAKELKDLNYSEKMEFHRMLTEAGVNCVPPSKPEK